MQTAFTSRPQALVFAPSQEGGATPIIAAPCPTPVALPNALTATRAPTARRTEKGFTLIELMIVVAVVGVLSSVAYPTFADQLQRVRRTDAVVAVMQVQWAQERWRSNSTAYGSLAEIGLPNTSAASHYTLQVSANTPSGYEVTATASGVQARDTGCAILKLSMQGANTVYASGPDASAANPASANRRCWSL